MRLALIAAYESLKALSAFLMGVSLITIGFWIWAKQSYYLWYALGWFGASLFVAFFQVLIERRIEALEEDENEIPLEDHLIEK